MNITGNRVGTRVNFFMGDGLQSKDFHSDELADQAFKALLKAKADPSEENIEKLYEFLNENIRLAKKGGFEFDPNSGEIFMQGHNTPVPEIIMETVEQYIDNGYPIESITNFWTLLMACPDVRIRKSLFDFIVLHNFCLTDKGYMIVYKTVDYMNMITQDVASFVSNAYLKVRKDWGTSAKKYVVYKQFSHTTDLVDTENFELKLTKKDTFAKWDIVLKRIELVGSLDELQGKLDELIDGDNTSVFTDLHTHEMEIRLGEPVHMPRKDCDSDPNQGCSYGLHVGSTSYVEGFANSESVVLVCLVNPMHVVAVPENNSSKIRVSQYFPFALATFEDRKIDIIQQPYFEYDYIAHEEEELKELLAANMDEERKICYNAPADDRSNDEYLTILEARVTNLAIAFEK